MGFVLKRWKLILALLIIFSILIIGVFYMSNKANESFKITQYHMSTEKDIKDLRILLVTDLHLKEYGKNNEDLLREMANLEPDLIAVVGDSVIFNQKQEEKWGKAIDFLNEASLIAPTVFSDGNHEQALIYHYKCYDFKRALENCDALYLNNQMEELSIEGNEILICGVYEDPDARHAKTDKIFKKFNDTKHDDKFKLLLNHCPVAIANTNITPNADLVLSGHEHGAQVVIPIIDVGLYSNNQGFFPKYYRGVNEIAGNTVIISTGLSNSYHWLPRINNIPELVVIDVN